MIHTTQWAARGAAILALLVAGQAAHAQELSAKEQRLFEQLVVAEARSEGLVGQALVARSVLNRLALIRSKKLSPGTYNAKGRTLGAVIFGNKQYEPVSNGSLRRKRTPQELAQARRAIALARDSKRLDAALKASGVGPTARKRLISATGFRTKSAYNDPSQNYGKQVYKNHVFNADRFSRRIDVPKVFERHYGQASGVKSTGLTERLQGSSDRGESNDVANPSNDRTAKTKTRPRRVKTTRPGRSTRRKGAKPDTTRYRGAPRTELAPGLARGSHGPGVSQLQQGLNRHGAQPPLDVDGLFGPLTQAALVAFQRKHGLPVTGKLDAKSLAKLRAEAEARTKQGTTRPGETPPIIPVKDPGGITLAQLREIMPEVSESSAAIFLPHLNSAMKDYEIQTRGRRAAFLAVLANDSAELAIFEQPRIAQKSADQALRVYERMTQKLGVPDTLKLLSTSPSLGFRLAARFWKESGCNELADQRDFRAVRFNLVLTLGMDLQGDQRGKYYSRARKALGFKDAGILQ